MTDDEVAGRGPVDPDSVDPDSVVVSVLHGGFDCAAYALMIGVYEDEEMSGAERYLDRQYGQLLSRWQDLGHYPGPLGTSVIVEPGRDVPGGSEPVGAYLVGLGSALTVGPRQLRFAVYRALVDRCLRLYRAGDRHRPDLRQGVGVSTALLGVRDDAGLRVQDSVSAILEGVRDVNDRLKEYESRLEAPLGVRVSRVQFVERYAHRADQAAAAVRRSRSAAALPAAFLGLEEVRVEEGDGALPAGAALLEREQSWTRFSVLERPASDASTGTSIFEVTALGREARADRVTHTIDRASLDALSARLAGDRTAIEVLKALRDRLIPHDLRTEFLTNAHLQLILDERTAGYSWEQLAAPLTDTVTDAALAGTGSVLRTFTESVDRRLQPVRARPGTALVIGAGRTVRGAELQGAVAEAKAVSALFGRNGIQQPELLTDDEGPLDLVTLNVALLGNHQVLHLAGHGHHVEGDTAASGVLLAPDFRFTADIVDSMEVVPELVFLNSCYNARIGLNRLSAGLARALMGIGVRAVVAAGWPIADDAARLFAETFYRDMLAGRSFGDAVATARRAIAGLHQDTWAAYQCYGDPSFVLRGRTAGLGRVDAPVSLGELRTRLATLLVNVADLSRPRQGAQTDRRAQLAARLDELEEWATGFRGSDPKVRELLALAARELGLFERAAYWYESFARTDPNGDGTAWTPRKGTLPVSFLQQAANCWARAAQALHRHGRGTAGPARRAGAVPLAIPQSFERAEALARSARTMLADDEGISILASVYKKWATAVPPGPAREERLERAVETYLEVRSTRRGDYGVENGIQVIALRRVPEAVARLRTLTEADADAGSPGESPATVIDAAPLRKKDFWARVADGDRALTALMTGDTPEARRSALEHLLEHYRGGFQSRSTYAERYSVIDHLDDLRALLQPGDDRGQLLDEALAAFEDWRAFTPSQQVVDAVTTAAPTVSRAAAPATAFVRLTAVPARCGDCLMLEYGDAEAAPRRILVDGGLGSAYAEGLGRVLGPREAPTHVDVAVVTHIDRDHIEGVLLALQQERLVAHEWWFNGRSQLERSHNGGSTRSVGQGDALDRLIRDQDRNPVVDGRALLVGPDGPPELALPGGATAVLLSPNRERAEALLRKWPEPTRDGDPVEALLRAFDEQVERGAELGRDGSIPNGSSIAMLFEFAGVSILFTGDAWAGVLEASIAALLERRNRGRAPQDRLTALPVSLFKVSHHGSRQNLSEALLRLIRPERLLICTDGSTFQHPDPDAVELLARHYPGVPFVFTDDTSVIRDRAALVHAVPPAAQPVVIDLGPSA